MTQSLPMEYFVNVTLLCHLLEALKISSNRSFIGNNLVMAYCIRLILVCSISHGQNWFQVNLSQGTFFSIFKFSIGNTSKRKLMRKALREFTPDFHRIQGFFYSQFTFHTAKCCYSMFFDQKASFSYIPQSTQCQGHRRRKR